MEPEPTARRDEGRRFPAAFVAGLVIVFIVVACAVGVSRYARSRESAAASAKLPFGPVERVYAANIRFDNITMARATNMLNQEFTYVSGIMTNPGSRSIGALEVTMEFHDPFNQVILRDAEQLVTLANAPLGAGEHRNFQVTLERIPAEWNQQYPTIRVTGLVLQ
ncbi:MAG TPA: FxLYD domain-containing protein [Candidatus Acidoferrales bacterium]|nr:FxLYD domain-containing protein [Candidatus Acidoferrales bacterium]